MKKRAFRFRSIDIRKMPGFPDGFRSYEEFHPQVNIIAGPNASGKSTTAKALQHIIWPDLSKKVQAKADILIGSREWLIEKDLSRTLVQREGEDQQIPSRPVVEERYRYMLALHDLVKVEDRQLAQLIIQEAAGGYDLDRAAEELGYSDRIPSRGLKVFQNFKQVNESYNRTYEKQSKLKNRQRNLSNLQKQLEEVEKARSHKQLLDLYKDYEERKRNWKWKSEQLEEYPQGLAKASGDEAANLRDLQTSINEIQTEIKTISDQLEDDKESLNHIELPIEGITDQKLDLLDERVDHLKSIQQKIEDRDNELDKIRQEKRSALRSLNIQEESLHAEQIEVLDLSKLEEWLQTLYQVKSRRQHKKEELRQLEEKVAEQNFDRETIQEGLRLLNKWMSADTTHTRYRYPAWIFWGMVFTGSLAGYFIYAFGITGFWSLLIPGLLIAYVVFKHISHSQPAESRHYVNEYRTTGLPVPEQWNVDQVTKIMSKLADELVKSQEIERKTLRLKQLKSEVEQIDQKEWKELEKEQEKWMESVQLLPDFVEKNGDSYGQFYWFLHRINEWKEADNAMESTRQAKKQLEHKQNELLEKFKEDLLPLDINIPSDPEEAAALARDLDRREHKRRELVQKIDTSEKQIEQHQKEIKRLEDQARQIYEKFGLDEPDAEEIERRLKMLDSYKDAREKCNQAEYALQQAKNALEDHPDYQEWQKDLEQMDKVEIQKLQNRYAQEAAKREDLQQEIQDIQIRVDRIQEEHDLEEALQNKDEALTELREYYQGNLESITGSLLVEKLRRITREQNQPKVYQRAIQLFSRITNGQFRLIIDKRNQAFRAVDTIQNKGKALDELSTGTRIQLLMAVRLAFIETQEQDIQLPVMADELLANSDEERAEAIIEAMLQMAEEGRQLFYFTAQADEVYKWRSMLEEHDMGFQIYELGQQTGRGFAYYKTYRPERDNYQLTDKVPEPSENDTHQVYGRKIELPDFNLAVQPISQLHLWYLMEDLTLLWRCLCRRINYWGGLQSFLQHGGEIQGMKQHDYKKLSDLVRWLERFQALYQQGRPNPIDREFLEQTDAITDNFIEPVVEKMEELQGDPERLVEALRNGEISGFRSSKIDQLENELLQQGYIEESDPLTRQEIRSRLQAYLDQLKIDPTEAERLLDRILDNEK